MEQKELFTAIETMLSGIETRLKGEITASGERIRAEIVASEERLVHLIDEKITASEGRTARLIDEKITASEERVVRLIDEKITASEGRMSRLIDDKITASEGRMRVDLSSTEERIKRHITSNNIEIGTIITEALENMNEDVDRIKTDIAVLRVNDAQKTIDLVKLSQAK